ncbi:MAG: hypothetical protein K2I93_03580, partial [Oscillospiraceae bacterium]|nr:hypothetical protein [Oscillospiraceae bacterium]
SQDITITNVQATNGSYVVTVSFTVPGNTPAGTYAVEFDGDVEARRASKNLIDITEVNGWIQIEEGVTEEPTNVTSYEYIAKGSDKFYFSHDPRPFDSADLLTSLRRRAVYTNAAGDVVGYGDWLTASDAKVSIVSVEGGFDNPKALYDSVEDKGEYSYVKIALTCAITDTLPDGTEYTVTLDGVDGANAYIGVKGDTDLDGVCNAKDAARVLIYAAEYGGNGSAKICKIEGADEVMENFVYFLSDVSGESENHGKTDANGNDTSANNALNASDAALQLIYAAVRGGNGTCNWATEVFAANATLPKYTAAIHEWEVAHPAE